MKENQNQNNGRPISESSSKCKWKINVRRLYENSNREFEQKCQKSIIYLFTANKTSRTNGRKNNPERK